MSSKKKLEKNISDLYQDLQAAKLKIAQLARMVREKQNDSLEQVWVGIQRDQNHAQATADAFLMETVEQACPAIVSVLQGGGLETESWESRAWSEFSLPVKKNPPQYIRIGELHPVHLSSQLPDMPAILPLVDSSHTFVFCAQSSLQEGVKLLTSMAWRIAAFSSPDKYQLTLIDSVDRGGNFASLLNLPLSVRGAKIYCQDQEIQEVLQAIADQIEEVTQRRLGDRFPTIAEYNAANPRIAIPYQFIIFTAYPHGFTDQSTNLLLSIARTGQRAGVYLVGGVLRDVRTPYDNPYDRLIEYGACILLKQPGVVEWDDPMFAHIPVLFDSPPSKNLTELISLDVEETLKKTKHIVEFGEFMLDVNDWWRGCSIDGLQAVIGVDQSGGHLTLDIGNEELGTYHVLIGGTTGSGKTNFLHELILSLSTTYSPEELELYLVDFKDGVEFQDYATYMLPHARAVVIEAEREFGLSILEYLDQEMTRRSELFKDAGVKVVNIQNYRNRTGRVLPRIIVIIDEFVDLFKYDDKILERAYQSMESIARQGRAYGIHIILAAQRPVTHFQNLQSIKSQIRLRIAFMCSEPDDSALILGERNEKAAQLGKIGLACVTCNPNLPEQTSQVSIGYVSQDDRTLYLKALRALFQKSKHAARTSKLVVFSRREPAIWRENPALREHLSGRSITEIPTFWLGQPIKLADSLQIRFESKERENLVIVGSDDKLANSILISGLLGLFLTCSPNQSEFFVITSSFSEQSTEAYWPIFKSGVPHSFKACSRAEVIDVLDELRLRTDHRVEDPVTRPKILLFIQGLHRVHEFQSTEDFSVSVAGENLTRILKSGPQVGIHSIIWVDRSETLRNATGVMNSFDFFSHRIALHMNSDESNDLLGVPDASRLGSNLKRLYYRSEWWPRYVAEKVKPYKLPSVKEVREITGLIRSKWGQEL